MARAAVLELWEVLLYRHHSQAHSDLELEYLLGSRLSVKSICIKNQFAFSKSLICASPKTLPKEQHKQCKYERTMNTIPKVLAYNNLRRVDMLFPSTNY